MLKENTDPRENKELALDLFESAREKGGSNVSFEEESYLTGYPVECLEEEYEEELNKENISLDEIKVPVLKFKKKASKVIS